MKTKGRTHLASMGVYLFNADALEHILTHQPDWIDFGHHVIPGSLKSRRVFAHLFDGFWEDIGTVRSYYEASMRMAGLHPPFDLYDPRYRIYTRPRYLPGSRLRDASVKDSLICEGCRIDKAVIRNAIIGIRSMVYRDVRIVRSILMGADFYETDHSRHDVPLGIGRNSRISGAIVDKNARIGANVVIRGSGRLKDRDGDGYAVRDGIVVVLKNAVIPDGTRIG